jgi:hypothetical protein
MPARRRGVAVHHGIACATELQTMLSIDGRPRPASVGIEKNMDDPSSDRGVMIVLAYLWPLALVPLLLQKDDAEVQWHAKHGLVLMVAELIVVFAYLIFTTFVSLATFGFGCALGVFLMVFGWIGILAVHIVAILKGVNGGRLIVPGISQYASRF